MNPEATLRTRPTRRNLVRTGAAVAAASALGLGARPAVWAHNMPKGEYASPEYDAALEVKGGMKAVFQSPALEVTAVAGENLNHFLLMQLTNWFNAFQFSYEMPAEDLHVIVATYANANVFNYNDAMWEKYKLGEKFAVTDPATGAPAVRNVFWPSRFGLDAPKDLAAPDSFYRDTGIEVLQQRGAIFLSCHNTIHGHANSAVADGRAPADMDAEAVVEDLQANMIPGTVLVPAVIAEVSRILQAGYSLAFIPGFQF